MRRWTAEDRRARLVARHHLAPATRAARAGVDGVARDLVGLHGTDPASVFLALWARCADVSVSDIERALYEDRTVVRMLGMRRTMFVVPVELAPVIHSAATMALVPGERRKLEQLVHAAGLVADPAPWLAEVEADTLAALERRGEATATELAADVPELARQISLADGKPYAGQVGVSTRVLFLLAAEGRIVRGRPRGSWTSSQYRWAPMASWLPGGRIDLDAGQARAELARCWLTSFGPAPVTDLKWWTGWTMGDARRALAAIDATEVGLDTGEIGFVLAGDEEPEPAPRPSVALLPALDPTAMGWAGRDWYLGEHRAALFDRSGNVGPTIWWGGRIVGGWAQRKDGAVVWRMLEDAGRSATKAVEREAARLESWLGSVRVTPRFRTPLERELVS